MIFLACILKVQYHENTMLFLGRKTKSEFVVDSFAMEICLDDKEMFTMSLHLSCKNVKYTYA